MITSFIDYNPRAVKFYISSLNLTFINFLTNTITIQKRFDSADGSFIDNSKIYIQDTGNDKVKINNYE